MLRTSVHQGQPLLEPRLLVLLHRVKLGARHLQPSRTPCQIGIAPFPAAFFLAFFKAAVLADVLQRPFRSLSRPRRLVF